MLTLSKQFQKKEKKMLFSNTIKYLLERFQSC